MQCDVSFCLSVHYGAREKLSEPRVTGAARRMRSAASNVSLLFVYCSLLFTIATILCDNGGGRPCRE